MKRDIEQRGRTPESVRQQYKATVRPSSVAFVRPSAANADLSVDGPGALDWKLSGSLRSCGIAACWAATGHRRKTSTCPEGWDHKSTMLVLCTLGMV